MPKNTKIFFIVIAIVAAFLLGTLFSQAPKQNIAPNMSQNVMQNPSAILRQALQIQISLLIITN